SRVFYLIKMKWTPAKSPSSLEIDNSSIPHRKLWNALLWLIRLFLTRFREDRVENGIILV
ncbi:hypothetical protein, partial [Bacillus toyonensis]